MTHGPEPASLDVFLDMPEHFDFQLWMFQQMELSSTAKVHWVCTRESNSVQRPPRKQKDMLVSGVINRE
jgi:hypothetical protein